MKKGKEVWGLDKGHNHNDINIKIKTIIMNRSADDASYSDMMMRLTDSHSKSIYCRNEIVT